MNRKTRESRRVRRILNPIRRYTSHGVDEAWQALQDGFGWLPSLYNLQNLSVSYNSYRITI